MRPSLRRTSAASLLLAILATTSGCEGSREGAEIIQAAALIATIPLIIFAGDHGEVTHTDCGPRPASSAYYSSTPCPTPFDH